MAGADQIVIGFWQGWRITRQQQGGCATFNLVAAEIEVQQRAIITGIADQQRAGDHVTCIIEPQLFVDARWLVHQLNIARVVAATAIADRCHIHAHQFELGAHIGT